MAIRLKKTINCILAAGLFAIPAWDAGAIASPPANDNFADAIEITGLSGQITGSNIDATKEAGEPSHANIEECAGVNSVWWKWAAPETGSVTFNTHGSDIDTLLAVYTGTGLGNLIEIASNDNDGESYEYASTVSFEMQSGVLYYIAVDGLDRNCGLSAPPIFYGPVGSIVFNWTTPAPPANSPDNYEDDDQYENASIIEINNSHIYQHHTFHDEGDKDWMMFYGLYDRVFDISVVNVGMDCDPVIELFDSDGRTLLYGPISWGTEGQIEELSYRSLKDEVIYILIQDASNNGSGKTEYEIFVSTNFMEPPGYLSGQVLDAISNDPIPEARIWTSANIPAMSLKNRGIYNIKHPTPGDYTIRARSKGYSDFEQLFSIESDEYLQIDISMTPLESNTGNINGDTEINLADAILGLRILADTVDPGDTIELSSIIAGNNGIGLQEIIYAMQKAAGIRQ